MTKFKRNSSILIMILLFLCFIMLTPVQSNAANKTKTKALKAYKSYLTKVRKKNSHSYFGLAYVDKDKIPELIVRTEKPIKRGDNTFTEHTTTLYSYKSGKVKAIQTNIVNGTFKQFSYYKNTGVFATLIDDGDYNLHYAFSMNRKAVKLASDGTKSRIIAKEIYRNPYYYEGFIYPKTNGNVKEIYKQSEFNAFVKKFNKGKKASKLKFVKNTAKNAKKKLK